MEVPHADCSEVENAPSGSNILIKADASSKTFYPVEVSTCNDYCHSVLSSCTLHPMSLADISLVKDQLSSSIQDVSLALEQLLQQRHHLQEEVQGRHVTIAQLVRVQEARATQLGLQPAVTMSVVWRR